MPKLRGQQENVTRSPERRDGPARCEAGTGRSGQAELRVTPQAQPPMENTQLLSGRQEDWTLNVACKHKS